jgi:adenosylcobyric acid synthase
VQELESKNSAFQKAKCIAIFGTGSDVGKSVIATALCRIFAQKGLRVAPFKAQNMSNNSGVTPEGLEMGRAQIVQAEAAGIPPHVDMNPILLKPTSDVGSQVVLLGKALKNSTAAEYHLQKKEHFKEACAALDRLRDGFDIVVMEGAGSCAEVNLMAHDIVNFKMAEYADARVILVSDIHRGGVFAQIVGTLSCLSDNQRHLISGFIINRFRGDISLFKDGTRWIEERTGKKVYGVLPWYTHFHIEEEDSVVIEQPAAISLEKHSGPAMGIIRIPHISNFTDFDPLKCLDGLSLHFIEKVQDLSRLSVIIIPGSKNTRFDLEWLHKKGWTKALTRYVQGGGHILGICGGYQMLGEVVEDPQGLEGDPGITPGLGLLPVKTILCAPKTTTRTRFLWGNDEGCGYEIHMGQTNRTDGRPMFKLISQNRMAFDGDDGCVASSGRVMGTYVHGLFDTPAITRRWLDAIGLENIPVSDLHGPASRDKDYDLLADHFRKNIDTGEIFNELDAL